MGIIDISDVSEDASNIVVFMDNVLESVVSTFQSYNVPLPTRQYWNVGQVAIDCAQLAVSLVQIYLGPPGDEASTPQRCNVPRTAVLAVTIAREIPVVGLNGRPPSSEKLQEASQISAIDAYVMAQSVNLFDQWEPGSFGVGVIATVDIPPPEGGFQVVNMQLTMAIP
jgi:hypothetical protein